MKKISSVSRIIALFETPPPVLSGPEIPTDDAPKIDMLRFLFRGFVENEKSYNESLNSSLNLMASIKYHLTKSTPLPPFRIGTDLAAFSGAMKHEFPRLNLSENDFISHPKKYGVDFFKTKKEFVSFLETSISVIKQCIDISNDVLEGLLLNVEDLSELDSITGPAVIHRLNGTQSAMLGVSSASVTVQKIYGTMEFFQGSFIEIIQRATRYPLICKDIAKRCHIRGLNKLIFSLDQNLKKVNKSSAVRSPSPSKRRSFFSGMFRKKTHTPSSSTDSAKSRPSSRDSSDSDGAFKSQLSRALSEMNLRTGGR